MAAIPGFNIRNEDVADVLTAIESVWRGDAVSYLGAEEYQGLTAAHKIRACLMAECRVRGKSSRRTAAERRVVVDEPEVT